MTWTLIGVFVLAISLALVIASWITNFKSYDWLQ